MKILLLFILLSLSLNSYSQLAHPYKVSSENEEFFIKSIPFSDQVWTDLGKTIVCKALDSSKVLYSIKRYFQPDWLFVSNDGKSVCFVLDWLSPSDGWNSNVIFFYKDGNLTHTYQLNQLIDTAFHKRFYSILYKNDQVDSLSEIRPGSLVSVGVKKGTDPNEAYLNTHNCFIKNDLNNLSRFLLCSYTVTDY